MSGDQNIVQASSGPPEGDPFVLRHGHAGLPLAAESIDASLPANPPTPSAIDLHAAAVVAEFWAGKRELALKESNPEIRATRLENIDAHEARVKKFLDLNSDPFNLHADLARVLGAVHFYSASLEVKNHGDFSGLNLFGVETTNKAAKIESCWGMLREVADFYVVRLGLEYQHGVFAASAPARARAVEQGWERFASDYANALDRPALNSIMTKFFRNASVDELSGPAEIKAGIYAALGAAAEAKLAENLKAPVSAVPLPYEFFLSGKHHGILMPDSKVIVKLNQALLSAEGANMFLFCCPDYSRERLPDGTFHYTMKDLGTGTGLTGERSLPVVNDIVTRLKSLADVNALYAPVSLFIGFADFEATLANAERCGMGPDPDEFLRRLGMSAQAVEGRLQELLPEGLDLIQIRDVTSTDDPVGVIEAQVVDREKGRLLANVSIGRVTDSFRDFVPDYQGVESFHAMVEKERATHIRLATADLSTFAEGKDRTFVEGFRRALDTLLVLRLDLMLEWKTEAVPAYIRDNLEGKAPFENKAAVVLDLQRGMAAGDPGRTEALQYLRAKIAAQGAEYSVMHKLMATAPRAIHLYADAANMWQLFGKRSIPMIGVRGGYTGADVVDLS